MKEETDASIRPNKQADVGIDDDYTYKLVGVVIHMGGAEAGHYLSYINNDCGKEFSSEEDWQ